MCGNGVISNVFIVLSIVFVTGNIGPVRLAKKFIEFSSSLFKEQVFWLMFSKKLNLDKKLS